MFVINFKTGVQISVKFDTEVERTLDEHIGYIFYRADVVDKSDKNMPILNNNILNTKECIECKIKKK